MIKSGIINAIGFGVFIGFIVLSYTINYENGIKTSKAFWAILIDMIKLLPCAFILIGLFEVFRIPMTIFEISFLGLPFTLVRLLVTIPLCCPEYY